MGKCTHFPFEIYVLSCKKHGYLIISTNYSPFWLIYTLLILQSGGCYRFLKGDDPGKDPGIYICGNRIKSLYLQKIGYASVINASFITHGLHDLCSR